MRRTGWIQFLCSPRKYNLKLKKIFFLFLYELRDVIHIIRRMLFVKLEKEIKNSCCVCLCVDICKA